MVSYRKYQILIVLVATFGISIPVIIYQLAIGQNPPTIHYILIFIVLPMSTWITVGYGFRKYGTSISKTINKINKK